MSEIYLFIVACSSHCAECDADGCKACENGYKLETDKTCKITVTSSSSGLSGGAIAGIVIGSLAAIGAASWIAYLLLKKASLRKLSQKYALFVIHISLKVY